MVQAAGALKGAEGEVQSETKKEKEESQSILVSDKGVTEISDIEKDNLSNYIDNANWINNYLRRGILDEDSPFTQENVKEIDGIDSIFLKVNPTTQDSIVYRGVVGLIFENKRGAIFRDKGFVSTSQDKDIAKEYGKNIIAIHIPKGSKVIDIDSMKMSGLFGEEKEILLPRGSKFKIIDSHTLELL